MSKLFVDEIKGNTGTTVTVPSGQTLNANLSGTNTIATGGKIAGTDTGSIYAPGMPIQVKYYTTNTAIQITSTNFSYIILDNCNITPKFSSSKILVNAFVSGNHDDNFSGLVRIYRIIGGSTSIIGGGPTAQGNMWDGVWFNIRTQSEYQMDNCAGQFLDSPSTTSQVTYQIRGMTTGDAEGLFINRTKSTSNQGYNSPTFSGLTLTEIAQ